MSDEKLRRSRYATTWFVLILVGITALAFLAEWLRRRYG
jgi:hypothetical protein